MSCPAVGLAAGRSEGLGRIATLTVMSSSNAKNGAAGEKKAMHMTRARERRKKGKMHRNKIASENEIKTP